MHGHGTYMPWWVPSCMRWSGWSYTHEECMELSASGRPHTSSNRARQEALEEHTAEAHCAYDASTLQPAGLDSTGKSALGLVDADWSVQRL